MVRDPMRVLNHKENGLLEALADLGKFDDIENLLITGIKARSASTDIVSRLQAIRVRYLLRAKKYPEAMQQAKAYYNVVSMAGTADAILLMMETLRASSPNNFSTADQFKKEQMAGAELSDKPVAQTVLAGIKINAAEFTDTIREQINENFNSMTARGNLLLLSDRAKEAQEAFERAYELSDDKQLAGASESLARTMRAQDGSIARANAFVLSLRPRKEPPPQPTSAPTTGPTEVTR